MKVYEEAKGVAWTPAVGIALGTPDGIPGGTQEACRFMSPSLSSWPPTRPGSRVGPRVEPGSRVDTETTREGCLAQQPVSTPGLPSRIGGVTCRPPHRYGMRPQ